MITTLIVFIMLAVYIGYNAYVAHHHTSVTRKKFDTVIHVNGIRGKSSVTRLIAAAMRGAGAPTVAKTTGTSARVILRNNEEYQIPRKEANISEQKNIMEKAADSGIKHIVFECMAINPVYQKYLEDKVMLSDIGVITNVREDHTEYLGDSLVDIARSLSATIPKNGHLVTAERNPEVLSVFYEECAKKGTELHVAPEDIVPKQYINQFKHFEFKENVAVALIVSQLLGVDVAAAMKSMLEALPDPGAFKLETLSSNEIAGLEGMASEHNNKTLYWANLFAVNDRESFIHTVNLLDQKVRSSGDFKKAVILNNRKDRPERVSQFTKIILNDLSIDYVFTFGVYEKEVNRIISNSNRDDIKIFHMGDSTDYISANGELLWKKIIESIQDERCLIVGAVNIHTQQSQELLGIFDSYNSSEVGYAIV